MGTEIMVESRVKVENGWESTSVFIRFIDAGEGKVFLVSIVIMFFSLKVDTQRQFSSWWGTGQRFLCALYVGEKYETRWQT